MEKFSLKSLLIIVVILLIGITALWQIQRRANPAAAWFSDAWQYRKAINIGNTSGSSILNSQIKIFTNYDLSSLVSTGKIQSDLDDIRFTDINGNLLKYWIEDNTLSSVDIWVLIPNQKKGDITILMYYGNPAANSASDNSWVADIGGTISGFNGYRIHAFKANGTYTSLKDRNVEVLVVAGGGGGAYRHGAGGGAGGLIYNNSFSVTNDIGVTIGAGGLGATNSGTNPQSGANSTFASLIAIGGGRAGGWDSTAIGASGGSGGGSVSVNNAPGIYGQGNSGGNGYNGTSPYNWGGGGGAGQAGGNGTATTNGNGGDGLYYGDKFSTTYGENGWFAGGGGGGGHIPAVAAMAIGGSGGGGNGGIPGTNSPGESAQANTGGGGGGATSPGGGNGVGGNGGSGIVLVRYQSNINTLLDISISTPGTEERSLAPIAHWSFDEGVGTSAFDSSSNRNNGVLGSGTSAPTWVSEDQCVIGKCLKFDGNDSINIGSSIATVSPFTISLWFKTNSVLNYRNLFHTNFVEGSSTNGGVRIEQYTTGNFLLGVSQDNTWRPYTVTNPISVDKWYHLVIVGNSSTNYLTTYLNGVQTLNTSHNSWPTTFSNIVIGKGHASSTDRFFQGNIDDFKIYAYARTAAQIKQDYKSGLAGIKSQKGGGANIGGNSKKSLSDGLVGYWKMDEGVGTSITDSSGNTNNGTTVPSWSSGKFGVGISLNGSTDQLTMSTANPIGTAENGFSLSAWFNQNGDQSNKQIIFLSQVQLRPNIFYTRVGSSWQSISYTNPSANTWHHIVGTFDGEYMKVYIDGVYINQLRVTDNISNASNFIIGGRGDTQESFNGKIDEVRIYNRALSKDEVKQLYEFNPNPVAYYDFNEGIGTSVYDKSGNGNNGVWQGTLGGQWTIGKYGKAGKFNGSDNMVNVSTSSILNFGENPFSVVFWVKAQYQSSTLIAKNTNIWANDPGWGMAFANSPQSLYLNIGNSLTHIEYNTGYGSLPEWTYLGLIRDSNNKIFFIKNGVIIDTGRTLPGNVSSTSNLIMGGAYGRLNGLIDEVKIYNYAISQKQIISDMNAGHPSVGSPIGSAIGHWKFDEGYGTVVNNSGNVGTTLNMTFTAGKLPTWTNNGKFGKALLFNNSQIEFTDYTNSPLDTESGVTYSLWAYPTTSNTLKYLMYKLGAYDLSYGDSTCGSGKFGISIYGVTTRIWLCALNTSSLNNWYHIAGSATPNGKIKIYINGVLNNSANFSYPTIGVSNSKLTYGDYSGGGYAFSGIIDDPKIYNYALTDEEIKLDYQHGASTNIGVLSTNTGSTASNNASSQAYCVPGDTSPCLPPIAEYNFDEGVGTTAYDTSGNNKNGIWQGTLGDQWKIGKIGKAGNFNGTNNYTLGTSNLGISGNTEFTMCAWIKWINSSWSSDYPSFMGNNSTGSTNNGLSFTVRQGRPAIDFWVNRWRATNALSVNTWYYLCGTKTAGTISTTSKIYVNGQLVSGAVEGTDTTPNITDSPPVIGRLDGTRWFQGLVDQVKYYNYARTPAQIAWDYNRGAPIGHWKLDECEGNIAYDASGLGNTGTIIIGVGGSQTAFGTCQSSGAWYNGRTGKINSAMSFDETDDYVSLGNMNIGNTILNFSVSVWAKINTNSGTWDNVVISKDNNTYRTFQLSMDQNKWVGGLWYNNTQGGHFYSNNNVVLNKWYHLVITFNGTIGYLYVDSILQNNSISFSQPLTNSSVNIEIGRKGTGESWSYFNGLIDDVRIYNYALTADQVKSIYNNNGAINIR